MGPGVAVQPPMPDIAHHTHHREPWIVRREPPYLDPDAHWVCVLEVTLDQGLIDDRHTGGRDRVQMTEIPARHQRNPHGPEIVRASQAICRARLTVRARIGLALNHKTSSRIAPADG